MKEILETIIKNLVDNPEAVEIKEVENEKTITFEVKAAEEDMGKIIGRQGKIAQSIRTVMRAVANRKDKKVTVEFMGENAMQDTMKGMVQTCKKDLKSVKL